MDAIDPLRGMPLQGLPLTDEVALHLKAKVRQARMEVSEPPTEASDVSDLSPEAARLSKPQFEAFLEAARDDISQMDRDSETFLQDATQRLVQQALTQKFGERLLDDPGFLAMEGKITQFILNDPESRGMVEGMLTLMDHVPPG